MQLARRAAKEPITQRAKILGFWLQGGVGTSTLALNVGGCWPRNRTGQADHSGRYAIRHGNAGPATGAARRRHGPLCSTNRCGAFSLKWLRLTWKSTRLASEF
jgi:hypothetical protein